MASHSVKSMLLFWSIAYGLHGHSSASASGDNDLSHVISDFVVASLKTPQLVDGFYFENKIFSPISMILCLSMVYSGSTGDTRSEMTATVYKNLKNEESFYQNIQQFLSNLDKTDGANFTLDLLNSILVQQNVNVSVEFSEKLTRNFRTQIYGVNFADDRARSDINRYVEEATKGKIGGDFLGPGSVNGATRLLLLNTIYFKGDWLSPFKDSKSSEMDFKIHPSAPTKTNAGVYPKAIMMQQMASNFWYLNEPARKVKVLGMPYLDQNLVFYIFLPDETSDLVQFESSLDSTTLKSLIDQSVKRRVEVTVPKFKLQSKIDLKNLLIKLSIKKLFDPRSADLSPIDGTRTLYASDAQHSASIEVNEQGSEGAAASSLTISFRSAPLDEEPLIFVADRPFLFALINKANDLILFVGRFVYP